MEAGGGAAGRFTPAQRRVLSATCLSHALIHVYELSVPALLLLIQRDFGAGDLRMGNVAALYALLFGLGALPAGWLVDRLGSKMLLVGCLWGGSAGMLGMAASGDLRSFALAAAGMGLALSLYHPAGTALLTHSLPTSGRVFAWHGMAGNGGVAAAGLLAGTLGALVGWRWALGLLGTVGLFLGLFALGLPAPRVHEIRAREGNGRVASFVLLLLATVCMGMVYRGMTTFLPKFLAVTYAADAQTGTVVGGWLTTVALLVGQVGMWAAGRWIDRGGSPARVFLVGAAAQVPLLLAIGASAGRWALPLFMGVACFHFLTQPAGNHLVATLTPPRLRGVGYGLYFLMTFGVGAAGATLGGWVSERWGLSQAFASLALILLPCVATTAVLDRLERPGRSDRETASTTPPRARAPRPAP